jgi:cell division septum initiation protein DivIVA
MAQAGLLSMQVRENEKLKKEIDQLHAELKVSDNIEFELQIHIDELVKRAKQHEEYDYAFRSSRDRDLGTVVDRLFQSIHILEKIEKCNATTHIVDRCLKNIDLHKFIKNTYERNF